MKLFKPILLLALVLGLTACVTVKPEEPVVVNGFAGYLEDVTLPQGSTINIAVIDFDTPGAIIAQKNFDIVRAPVPFKFIFKKEMIDSSVNYGVVAMISYNGRVLFQTYDKFEVINNGKLTTEVLMKPVK
ncbi:chaperone for general secretion pathway YbaY [Shewanella sp. WXL01]|uniref:Chaperone for general secretion pathway YbaY n=1 Tax=Shewanella maritima TaxID=2520507 RepID=A0A411PKE2_9GAMM|nr:MULTISPECIES: YbaY family lipoprotein [Shewanella]NKF51026.1 chaperone for general secretion pathway YbaY [Shewanella sp. WXL01]QBF83985.1 chaperone for general secretion pathway YbaY [Shewanella maritima]